MDRLKNRIFSWLDRIPLACGQRTVILISCALLTLAIAVHFGVYLYTTLPDTLVKAPGSWFYVRWNIILILIMLLLYLLTCLYTFKKHRRVLIIMWILDLFCFLIRFSLLLNDCFEENSVSPQNAVILTAEFAIILMLLPYLKQLQQESADEGPATELREQEKFLQTSNGNIEQP